MYLAWTKIGPSRSALGDESNELPICHREKRSDVAIHLTGLPRPAGRARNDKLYEFIGIRPAAAGFDAEG